MTKLKIMVVDDSVVIRKLISTVVNLQKDMEVCCVAPNGDIAMQKLDQNPADVITMDFNMPGIDGIETVREIRRKGIKTPIVMVSSVSNEGARMTWESLEAGADDFISKPGNLRNFEETIELLELDLIPKIRALGGSSEEVSLSEEKEEPPVSKISAAPALFKPEAIVIGASTGGPVALNRFFADLGNRTNLPILVVQHMPPYFTKNFADRLNQNNPLSFKESEEGDLVQAGHVYIAKGGKHMEVYRDGGDVRIRLHSGPMENSCRPAADVLFRSAAEVYGGSLIGAIFTGMGSDGCAGLKKIKSLGGRVIAQDKESSVVWGMPGSVVDAGLADCICPVDEIANCVLKQIEA